jgi:hypothetical protein
MTHIHGVDDGHGYGVFGESNSSLGVKGQSNSSFGVCGRSDSGFGVVGFSNSYTGVYGHSASGYAAWLDGKVNIRGPLFKPTEAHFR